MFPIQDSDMATVSPLQEFLDQVTRSGDQKTEGPSIQLIPSLRKRPNFLWFMSGLEEGLFPHRMSTEQEEGLEEERRNLCRYHESDGRTHLTYAKFEGFLMKTTLMFLVVS